MTFQQPYANINIVDVSTIKVVNSITLRSTVLRDIGALSRTIHAICDMKYRELNLQKGQYIFLTRICENGGISLKNLSIILKVDKTTTTKATQKLIVAGYIFKEKDDLDNRVYRLYPTDKGLRIYNTIIEEENRAISACFKGLSKQQISKVHDLINIMKENIESDWRELKNYKGAKNDKKSEV